MNVLFLHFGSREDFFYLSFCFQRLRKLKKGTVIYVIVPLHLKNVINDYILKDFVYIYPTSVWEQYKMIYKINKIGLDYLIDVQRDFYKESFRLAKKLTAKNKIGYNFDRQKKPYTLPIKKVLCSHLIEYYLHGMGHFGIRKDKKFYQKDVLLVREKKCICISLFPRFDGQNWIENRWLQLLEHHQFSMIRLVVLKSRFFSQNFYDRIQKLRYISLNLVESKEECFLEISNSNLVITNLNQDYLAATSCNKSVLLLDENRKERTLRYPITPQSSVAMPQHPNGKIKDISFDIVLKKVRELVLF